MLFNISLYFLIYSHNFPFKSIDLPLVIIISSNYLVETVVHSIGKDFQYNLDDMCTLVSDLQCDILYFDHKFQGMDPDIYYGYMPYQKYNLYLGHTLVCIHHKDFQYNQVHKYKNQLCLVPDIQHLLHMVKVNME